MAETCLKRIFFVQKLSKLDLSTYHIDILKEEPANVNAEIGLGFILVPRNLSKAEFTVFFVVEKLFVQNKMLGKVLISL